MTSAVLLSRGLDGRNLYKVSFYFIDPISIVRRIVLHHDRPISNIVPIAVIFNTRDGNSSLKVVDAQPNTWTFEPAPGWRKWSSGGTREPRYPQVKAEVVVQFLASPEDLMYNLGCQMDFTMAQSD